MFGDSLIAALGDPRGVGWVGRVAAVQISGLTVTTYPLGVRDESTEEAVVRMPLEAAARFARGDDHRIVLATGISDAERDTDPLAVAAALDFGLASVSGPALVVGPAPVGGDELRHRIAQVDAVFTRVCARRGVPYVATYSRLVGRLPWERSVAGRSYPDATGYALLAKVVLEDGWRDWLTDPHGHRAGKDDR